MSKRSRILVIIQFSCLAYFIFSGNFMADGFLLFIQIFGIIIGTWGVLSMKIGNFNIQPEVKNTARFVNSGPYRLIRNPMYFSLILIFGISILHNFNFLSLTVFLIFCTVLIMKINMEERFLTQKFGEVYTRYLQKSYRLIPFVY